MSLTKSSNPVFNNKIFQNAAVDSREGMMTIQGAMNKTALLLLFAVLSAGFVWNKFFAFASLAQAVSGVSMWLLGGAIGGFILAMIISFSPRRAPILAPIYAVLEGLFLGGISAIFEARYPGLVMRAVGLTFGVFAVMLFLYRSRIIRVTNKFRMIMVAAIGGIMLVYLVSFIISFFGVHISFLTDSSRLGIGFSLLVVGIAAFSLMLDFDLIEQAASQGAPKYMEWYGAFGLMVTLVWLYLEILKLLARLANNRN
ncbi:MAG: Bax inhibitor-1/YccA family protein [Bacteroidota bacterium]|nr:Bax inhibitor-1/YccA family protein [Bacteroidota bacterium]MDP4206251.1 Bax inhibitor-1/YccA family protein [Bacteroidota bacterium]